jgi:hypothetical protein
MSHDSFALDALRDDAGRLLYFAYGSCMNHASLAASLGVDVALCFVGPALLRGRRLAFNYAAVSEPVCYANIPIAPDASLEGGVFALPDVCQPALDKREGVGQGRYARHALRLADGRRVLSYLGLVTLGYEAAPSRRYRDTLAQGLLDCAVSARYHDWLLEHMDRLPDRHIVHN